MTGCSGLSAAQLVPERSPSSGARESSPANVDEALTSSGRDTNAPFAVSSTEPQSSSAKATLSSALQSAGASIGPSTVVHSGSLVFKLTASLAKHEPPPHGHWYACTSNGKPSCMPRTREKTPTPW
jgi:hypothetical protein